MAGRGKVKDYRIQIKSVKQWAKESEFEGLNVVEIYSSFFGSCQAITPTIQTLMLSIEDSENKIRWPCINVAQLEEEQRETLMEEEKKKQEQELVLRRKIREEGKVEEEAVDEQESDAKAAASFDRVKIKKLEEWSGYDDARPLWVFFQKWRVHAHFDDAQSPQNECYH
jgi:thiol-disulfide isomerase/thioredoxin